MYVTRNVFTSYAHNLAGKARAYPWKLGWRYLSWAAFPRLVHLQHEGDGPTIALTYCEFKPTSPDETRLFWKDKDGWKFQETTAFGLRTPEADIDDYILQFTELYLAKVHARTDFIGQVLQKLSRHREVCVNYAKTELN